MGEGEAGGPGGTAGITRPTALVRLLGPVELRNVDGTYAAIVQSRQRVLLTMLAVVSGRMVPDEALIDALWGETRSRERKRNLHSHVSVLRRRLDAAEPGGGSRLARTPGGYRLALRASELDLESFQMLSAQAREASRAGDLAGAREAFRSALGLWRGPALAGVTGICSRLAGEAAVLEEDRAAVLEDRVECDLKLGRHGEIAAELAGLVQQYPLRERLASQLMVALYRCGRRGEALAVFTQARLALRDQLGLDPGRDLTEMQRRILADDPTMAGPAVGGAVAGPSPEGPRAARQLIPRQLPAQTGHFAGRQVEIKALDELLDRVSREGGTGPVVVTAVVGMAGVGKTTLAVHWAHKVAHRFPDGQLCVNLRDFDAESDPIMPDDVVAWFLSALGVAADQIPTNTQARAALYRSVLADRRVLIVLDNARDPAQIRPLLAGGRDRHGRPRCRRWRSARSAWTAGPR